MLTAVVLLAGAEAGPFFFPMQDSHEAAWYNQSFRVAES